MQILQPHTTSTGVISKKGLLSPIQKLHETRKAPPQTQRNGTAGAWREQAGCKQNQQTLPQQLPWTALQRPWAAAFTAGSQQHLHAGISYRKGLEKDVLNYWILPGPCNLQLLSVLSLTVQPSDATDAGRVKHIHQDGLL